MGKFLSHVWYGSNKVDCSFLLYEAVCEAEMLGELTLTLAEMLGGLTLTLV